MTHCIIKQLHWCQKILKDQKRWYFALSKDWIADMYWRLKWWRFVFIEDKNKVLL